jgi:hypothetical protein
VDLALRTRSWEISSRNTQPRDASADTERMNVDARTDGSLVVNFLKPKQVAEILGLSLARVYAMDAELEVIFAPRGNKQRARHYRPDVIERVRAARERASPNVPSEVRGVWRRLGESAARRGRSLRVSLADVASLSAMSCASCGATASPHHDLALVLVDGEFSAENLAASCQTCRAMRGQLDAHAFLEHVIKIAGYQTTSRA